MNCSVRPLATVGFAGATAIDVNAAAVTVSVSLGLVIPPSDGGDRRRAGGQGRGQAAVLEIVATEAVADAQVTWLVRLAVEPSV